MKRIGLITIALVLLCVSLSFGAPIKHTLRCDELGKCDGCVSLLFGTIRVRFNSGPLAKCNAFEVPISWNLQGPKGIPVSDANGQFLGYLASDYTGASNTPDKVDLFIPSLKYFVSVYNENGTTYVGDRMDVMFTSDNCTGTRYYWPGYLWGIYIQYEVPILGIFERIIHRERGDDTHYFVPNLPLVQIESKSYLDASGTCRNYTVTYHVVTGTVITLPFTTPVAMPLSFN